MYSDIKMILHSIFVSVGVKPYVVVVVVFLIFFSRVE